MPDLKNTVIGIELGSTRIKAMLLGEDHTPIASGSVKWENVLLENGIWSHRLNDAVDGLRECFRNLKKDYSEKFGETLTTTGAMGVSAMMHGFIPFDKEGKQLTEFRTWRNMMTAEASAELEKTFDFPIPQRWSVAYLYDAILKKEPYVDSIASMFTLSGYIHYVLTGEHVTGYGDGSGMFPLDTSAYDYDGTMLDKFARLTAEHGWYGNVREIFPKVVRTGETAGYLTEKGAKLLDPDGDFLPGVPFCPPEGDGVTGFIATNCTSPGTGFVSAGTSVFANVISSAIPSDRFLNVGVVPSGDYFLMANVNSCSTDIDSWIRIFGEFSSLIGKDLTAEELFSALFNEALKGDPDCGGLAAMCYVAGEPAAKTEHGRSVFSKESKNSFTLANFMRAILCSPFVLLKVGLDKMKACGVGCSRLYASGGFFKTEGVGTRLLSAAAGVPVTMMSTAGEGGAYGMALLAAYMKSGKDESLADFLSKKVFAGCEEKTVLASEEEIAGFERYYERVIKALPIEYAATEYLK